MSFDQKDIDLIEEYQGGQLSEYEAEQVRNRLANDTEFQRLFEELKKYQAGIRQTGRDQLRLELKQLEQTLPPVAVDNNSSFFRPNFIFRAAAGISIIFGLGILLFVLNDKPTNVDEYLSPYPNIVYPVERSGQVDDADDRQLAYQAYDREQYSLAVERYSKLDAITAEDRFYLGLSLMLEAKYDSAIQILNQVIDSPHELNIPARWYAGLCYVKLEKPEEAAKVLQPLIDQKTSYATKASSILNQTN